MLELEILRETIANEAAEHKKGLDNAFESICKIFEDTPFKFIAKGSYSDGTYTKFSDLDLFPANERYHK